MTKKLMSFNDVGILPVQGNDFRIHFVGRAKETKFIKDEVESCSDDNDNDGDDADYDVDVDIDDDEQNRIVGLR